jgi:ubiquinone/menaquinone biosynthesis C-methylase UbiE
MTQAYVHGYGSQEHERLHDQGSTLVELIHGDTTYPPGALVLEAGCGVGVQTVVLARRNRDARFVAIDRSEASLALARRAASAARLTNVEFRQADILALPFAEGSFDHVFVCFVLEHVPEVARALASLVRVLKPGGTITIFEGDHGPTFFHPQSRAARAAIQCLITLQTQAGGTPLVGRQLHPLMIGAGLSAVRVKPRIVYMDASRPDLVEGFTRKTFIAMIEGVRAPAVAGGLTTPRRFDAGVQALHRTTQEDGVFGYLFFKGIGQKAVDER